MIIAFKEWEPKVKESNITVRIPNKHLFQCPCGCNVFHRDEGDSADIYRCNACDLVFHGE